MALIVNEANFYSAHKLIEQFLYRKSPGHPFVDFDHPFLLKDELDYKQRVHREARDALQLDSWPDWLTQPGKILAAARRACSSSISSNLLNPRYGERGSSSKALYRVETEDAIAGLEAELYNVFLGGSGTNPIVFGAASIRLPIIFANTALAAIGLFFRILRGYSTTATTFPSSLLPSRESSNTSAVMRRSKDMSVGLATK